MRVGLDGKSGQVEALAESIHALMDRMVRLVVDIKRSAGELAGATKEIVQGNSDLSQRTAEQAASLEEMASNMEQMTNAVRASADHSAEARRLVVEAGHQASRGADILAAVISAMREINIASSRTGGIIGHHRRYRVPDESPRAERRGGGSPCRRGWARVRRRRGRGA